MKKTIAESDLYAPVRDYLNLQGYTVRGEVHDCDIAAVKDEELVLIELKRSLNIELLLQATQRQRTSHAVYVAVPYPHEGLRTKRWRGIYRVLRRLELGLILIDMESEPATVEIKFHPLPYQPKRSAKQKRAILREIAGRSGDDNTGGSTRRPRMTAYREACLFAAFCLKRMGPSAPKKLREAGAGEKVLSLLSSNFYGWFERVDRGVYGVSPKGLEALYTYSKVAERFESRLDPQKETPVPTPREGRRTRRPPRTTKQPR